jgi:CBS-domain-containing membrane protein
LTPVATHQLDNSALRQRYYRFTRLERFRQHDGERLPVVNDLATKRLIGTIAKTDVILALAGSTSRSATMVDSPS